MDLLWRRRVSPTEPIPVVRRGRRIATLVIRVVGVLTIVVLLLTARGLLARWTRQMAARQIGIGAISAAQDWLSWSSWLQPNDGQTELLLAACYRQRGERDHWEGALQAAQRKGAPAAQLGQELELGAIREGSFDDAAENRMTALIEAGAPPHEVAAAYVRGYLMQEKPKEAQTVLDAWAADDPQDPHLAYMRGVYWLWMGDTDSDIQRAWVSFEQARKELEKALARQPRHELARFTLAEWLEEQDRLDAALRQFAELVARFPHSEAAKVGLARLLRKVRRVDEARAVLAPLAASPTPSANVALELGQLALESAEFAQAEQWFDRMKGDPEIVYQRSVGIATVCGVDGKVTRAERLFAEIDATSSRLVRIDDLRARLRTGEYDERVAAELRQLTTAVLDQSKETAPAPRAAEKPATTGPELFAAHCAACHGANGDGRGRAAPHLFPRPRDLRTGKCLLVSTLNGIPTLQDLESMLRRGMPGTAMRAYDDLTANQRALLAREVQRLNVEGTRQQFTQRLKDAGEELDEDEIESVVQHLTTPGEVVRVPRIGPHDPSNVARGRELFVQLGCQQCHGEDGMGAGNNPQYDDQGNAVRPRDLAHEPFKGGQEPESIYLRIAVGMPGSPHPSCLAVSEQQRVDVVQYCRSLSQEPKRLLTNHERAVQATTRAYLLALGRPSPR